MSRQDPPIQSEAIVGPQVKCLADVEPECVEWLWGGRIPRGKLTVIHGPPGDGKSTVMVDLASRISRGEAMPEGRVGRPAAGALFLSAEDGLADTIRPRLDAAGGDPRRVHALTAVRDDRGHDRTPSIPEDIGAIEALIAEHGIEFVIVDVLDAYLGGGVDSHRSHDVRRALAPLAQMAERTGAAVVALGHLRKSSGSRSLYRALGSIGIVGAARSAMVLGRDPNDDDARILAPTKSNLAAEAPALRFRLVDAGGVARVEWLGVAEGVNADDLDRDGGGTEARTASETAEEMLQDVLAGGASMPARDVYRIARECGVTERTLRRAAGRIGVVIERRGVGRDHRSEWRLPTSTLATPATDAGLAGVGARNAVDAGNRLDVKGKAAPATPANSTPANGSGDPVAGVDEVLL